MRPAKHPVKEIQPGSLVLKEMGAEPSHVGRLLGEANRPGPCQLQSCGH